MGSTQYKHSPTNNLHCLISEFQDKGFERLDDSPAQFNVGRDLDAGHDLLIHTSAYVTRYNAESLNCTREISNGRMIGRTLCRWHLHICTETLLYTTPYVAPAGLTNFPESVKNFKS